MKQPSNPEKIKNLFAGIDTSNYTTSFALCGAEEVSVRKIIDIPEGKRGIRQSDGVFVHLKELPGLLEGVDTRLCDIAAIGVSDKPRNQEGSYMPVFVAGESFARVMAKTLGVPLYRFSHQDGHIMAGICSAKEESLLSEEFTAVHLSGGTTEIVNCKYDKGSFSPQIAGGTLDISAGQLLDRLGVKMGLKFPCGKELDSLSLGAERIIELKTSVKEGYINFSGAETKLLSLAETEDKSVLAKSALIHIGKSLNKALESVKPKKVLFVGGVASNTILRELLKENRPYQVYFASPELSSDNGMGIAKLAELRYKEMR